MYKSQVLYIYFFFKIIVQHEIRERTTLSFLKCYEETVLINQLPIFFLLHKNQDM